jgi:hypothetical protein
MRERSPSGWDFGEIQSMTDWAAELRAIPSSTVSRFRQQLIQCDVRLASLTQPSVAADPEPTPPRKASRSSKKVPVALPEASAIVSMPQKAGIVYVNAESVCSFLCFRTYLFY